MFGLLLVAAAFAAQDVSLTSADGVKLHAIADRVAAAPKGVVLVHQEGRSAADWRFVSERLAKSGFTVVAPDLRGHGTSAAKTLTEADYKNMIADVDAAVKWLRAQGAKEISCVGASLGANLCLQSAARDPGVVNVVLLSPGLNVKGVTAGDAVAPYGNRPMLLVAASGDAGASKATELLAQSAVGQKHRELVNGASKGTKMLDDNASLAGTIQSWLLGTFKLASGDIVKPQPVQSDPGTVETTGTKLGSHK